jgi:hypothetical protein
VFARSSLRKAIDPLALSLFAIIIYTFVHGAVDVPYFKNDLSGEFWVFLAIASFFSKES